MKNRLQILNHIYSFVFTCGWMITILTSCQIPNPDQTGTTQPTLDPQAVQQISEGVQAIVQDVQTFAKPDKVEAWVDQLIVKVQPGKDMPKIATMQEGEVATYLYQRTVEQTEYTLRGQKFREAWVLVKLQTGQMGWVHEGGIKYISPGFQKVVEELLGPPPSSPGARVATIPADPASLRLVIPGKQFGAINKETAETELIQIYGTSRVGRSNVQNAEGQQLPCTVVFPNSPAEARIVWKTDARQQVKEIYLDQPDSPWYTKQGLGVGAPLSEVVKANKAPISFTGFSGAYSGTVVNWRGGALAPYGNHCYVVLAPTLQGNSLATYQKANTFTTNAPNLQELGIRVKRWVVYLD